MVIVKIRREGNEMQRKGMRRRVELVKRKGGRKRQRKGRHTVKGRKKR